MPLYSRLDFSEHTAVGATDLPRLLQGEGAGDCQVGAPVHLPLPHHGVSRGGSRDFLRDL